MNVHFISLGCPRNLVDTEIMLGQLLEAGHTILSDPSGADCVVVNTCSFIESAVDESIDIILEMSEWKKQKTCGGSLIVAGCLPQRYGSELVKTLPEVDVFLGTGGFDRIVEAAEGSLNGKRVVLPNPGKASAQEAAVPRFLTTPAHTAYLKIAEGCSNRCTYCIIPKLRGPQRSRPVQEILSEARFLAESGVKELILVAQNTTAYGKDLGIDDGLASLLEALTRVSGLHWIRFLYGHPEDVSDGLMEVIASHRQICSYFDIPAQHISEPVLKRMGRRYNGAMLYDLFERIRNKVPDAALRTTLLVGFPGESDDDFESLLRFVERVRFDHLGAFVYSDGPDLPSNTLSDHVPEGTRQERLDLLMLRQRDVSRDIIRHHVGKTLPVLIDGPLEGTDALKGRTCFQSPEIDGMVYVSGSAAEPGTFAHVRIIEGDEYDLRGVIA
jgi:ribosomal protein S12 methylthiotransferase